jgi:hypothetical protein
MNEVDVLNHLVVLYPIKKLQNFESNRPNFLLSSSSLSTKELLLLDFEILGGG